MKIRRATVEDVPAMVELNQVVHGMHAAAAPEILRKDPRDEVVAEAFKEAIRSSSSYWLVAEEEQVVAFLSAEFRQRAETWYMMAHSMCYLGGIIVAPEFRRKGVARALVSELRREACARGVTRIELDVWKFNEEARRAFAGLGFHPVMERMVLSAEEGG
jgi:ribosomal protein S18 acetylase RimI-like enzyme